MSIPVQSPSLRGLSRRRFLATAAAAFATPYVVPARVLAEEGKGPNSRICLGFIGVGGRGSDHVQTCVGRGDAQILAVCDPYKGKREGLKKLVEDRYARKKDLGAYKGCDAYSDFREVVARPDLDAVFIASPEHWHALHTLAAVRAGKDVYCEKAMTLTVAEGRVVCETVRRYGRVVQIGMQQRSWDIFRFACELVRNGYIGKLQTVEVAVPGGRSLPNAPAKPAPPDIDYDLWLGPCPWKPYTDQLCSYNWYFVFDHCVGWIQSWGIHYLDVAQWGAPSLCTKPLEVEGSAVFPTDGPANTSINWKVHVTTADGLRMTYMDESQGKHGVRFEGDKGTVFVNRGGLWTEPTSLKKVTIKPDEEHLYDARDHHQCFFDCVRSRRDPSAPVEVGHSGNVLAIVSDTATRLGHKVQWDWTTEQFVKDDAANRFLGRAMRSPWRL
jgi:predicted dehydrogenase